MTWEQKFMAIMAISRMAALHMREPGNWYVFLGGLSVGGDGFLRSIYTSGDSPEDAIETTWANLTAGLPSGSHIRVSSTDKSYQWTGYMWSEVSK